MAAGSRTLDLGSDELSLHDCNVCTRVGETSEGVSYCTVCHEHLCQRCEQAHRGSRASEDHQIVTGRSIPSGSTRPKQVLPIMFCDTHKASLLDLYCTSHDDVICTVCKITGHAKCDTIAVSRHTKNQNVQETFSTVDASLGKVTDKFNDLMKTRKTDRVSMKAQLQTCLQDMNQIRKNVNNKFDKLEKKMTTEFREIEDKLSGEIDDHEAISKDVLHQINQLHKTLNECKNMRDDDVTFIVAMKAKTQRDEFNKIITNIHDAISSPDISFVPNDVITDVINQLDSLGTIVTHNQTKGSASVLNMNIRLQDMQKEIKLGSDYVRGCVFMADGHMVVGCDKGGLKVFDKTFRITSQLPVRSIDVAVVNDVDVIVTQGSDKRLQRIQVLPGMVAKSSIQMDRKCYGVDVYGDEIYVTCHNQPGNGEVRVLTMDGKLLKTLGFDIRSLNYNMFTSASRVKVSHDGSKLFVSDWSTHIVTCLNKQGHVIYKYAGSELREPIGLYVDGEDNLLVCGLMSHNIHVIRSDGRAEKILLSRTDWMHYPRTVSYRQTDGCLVVGGGMKDATLAVYSTRK